MDTLPSLFEAQVARTPAAVAVESPLGSLTYAELDALTGRLARRLARIGAGPEDLVGVALPRSPGAVVAMLAALRCGAAYLPLDPALPPARRAAILHDAAPLAVIARDPIPGPHPAEGASADGSSKDGSSTDGAFTDGDRVRPLRADHAAYVIYTSGSTGRPKGVVVEHAAIVNLALDHIDRFGLGPGERVIQLIAPGFDPAVANVAMTLLSGATLVLPGPYDRLTGEDLATALDLSATTCVMLPAALLATLPDGDLPSLRTVVSGGERLGAELVARFAPGRVMVNAYGPTETTVAATVSRPLRPGSNPPIGGPVRGARLYVLDERLDKVPDGTPGELYVGGAGLARGYLNQPGLTALRFVADPYGPPGARMYRTGDLVRVRPDGELDFLGRCDDQIKLHGTRIEPAEISAALERHPAVRQAAVVLRDEGRPRLVAYVVTEPGAVVPDRMALRGHLAGLLPAAMVPAQFVVLAVLPLTANGKVDTRALPEPVGSGL